MQKYTTRYFPIPSDLYGVPVAMALRSLLLVAEIHEIYERYDEHPYQIDEVPVKPRNFDVIRVITAVPVAQTHYQQGDHTCDDVGDVQPGDAEKRGTEQTRSPRVLEHRHAFVNESEPFPDMQERECNARQGGNHRPAEGACLIPHLCRSDSKKHGQATGEQDQRHYSHIDNADRKSVV